MKLFLRVLWHMFSPFAAWLRDCLQTISILSAWFIFTVLGGYAWGIRGVAIGFCSVPLCFLIVVLVIATREWILAAVKKAKEEAKK